MKTVRIALIILLANFTFAGLYAQQVKSVIPYRLAGGKIIADFYIGEKLLPFIFDTGGQTAVIGELAQELGFKTIDSLKVTDANGSEVSMRRVGIEGITTHDNAIRFLKVPAMVISGETLACFNAVGIIGSELFQKMIIEIDGKARTITITSAEKTSGDLRRMQQFAAKGIMPVISLQASETEYVAALFDSGYGGFVSLKKSDYELLREKNALEVVSEGYGASRIGVAGMEEAGISYRVNMPLVQVGAVKFRNVRAQTSNPPYTLLGTELLDYGKVIIDYPRQRFYFEPYALEYDLARMQNNLDLMVKDGDLVVSTVWSGMKDVAEVGDRVIRINGKPVRKFDFYESIINGIPELKALKKTTLTLQTSKGIEKEVELTKK